MASTSLEGEEDLSYLYWVSTLEERPGLGVLSVSKYLGQKSRFGVHARGEAYLMEIKPKRTWRPINKIKRRWRHK